MTETSIADLQQRIKHLEADYRSAQQASMEARSRECAALNELNAAQKAFDAAVTKFRSDSASGSDWKAANQRRIIGTL